MIMIDEDGDKQHWNCFKGALGKLQSIRVEFIWAFLCMQIPS